MGYINLVLIFKSADSDQWQIKRAASIKVDGRGGLVLYGLPGGDTERIEFSAMRSFSLVYLNPATPVSPCTLPN